MAEKSDPSIYDDRTTIGSSDELDEYGVWVKSEAQDLPASLPDIEDLPDIDSDSTGDLDLPDFSDFDAPDNSGTGDVETGLAEIGGETEDLPAIGTTDVNDALSGGKDNAGTNFEFEEIPENSELPEGLAPTSMDKDGFTEVSMNDFLDSASNLDIPESVDFGDLDSSVPEIEPLESHTANDSAAVKPAAPAAEVNGNANLSTQLLQKIADELSSIKEELSGLKKELSVVRGDIKAADNAEAGGFFDEEDDEKIALTGDELDNILNTANFTEEAGSNESLEGDFSFDTEGETLLNEIPPGETPSGTVPLLADEVPLTETENILDETGNAEINFDEVSELDGAIKVEDELKNNAEDFDIALDLTSDLPGFEAESTELNILREEGASPLTPAPEDTSYLDEDPLAGSQEQDISESAIDFSGAVIDEPDLSTGITENPVSEPAIGNISIDLEMEEPVIQESSGPDDFIFETEETMEIPVTEEPLIDDDVPLPKDISVVSPPFPPAEETPFASSDDIGFTESMPPLEEPPVIPPKAGFEGGIPSSLKQELKTVLSYMDQLLESLPEEKIEEFAKSEYFDTYKKLFEELGLV